VIQLIMAERLESEAIARMLDDLSRADLGDPRRVLRAQLVVERLAAKPDASLPDALVTDAELEGAYRLFGNDQVSFEHLFDAHALGTAERARGSGLVLAIHDTTHCTFPHADPKEVGYLNTGKPGFPLHMTLLVDTCEWRRPLGLTHAEVLPRSKPPRRGGPKRRPSSHATGKDPDREFLRWQRGIDVTEARLIGTRAAVIHIADRESDSYALMATCLRKGQRFIFRARNNRNALQAGATIPIRTLIDGAAVVLEREVPLSRRLGASAPATRRTHPPRESRVARLCFSATTATFCRPNIVGAHMPKTIDVHVLHVFEQDAPDGQEPVDWLLYTTEPLDTVAQIEAVVDYYRCRWQIEELNKALKTGCVVQERRLESLDALTTMLAISLPIAVELLALRTLARADSTCPASAVLTTQQLAALRHISHRPLPKRPTVQDVLWCIAGLGGHIKNNGAPGWQVLQRGMEKFVAFAAGWCAREEFADL
jgi:Transposase DNA-binding/Transposase DDE domain